MAINKRLSFCIPLVFGLFLLALSVTACTDSSTANTAVTPPTATLDGGTATPTDVRAVATFTAGNTFTPPVPTGLTTREVVTIPETRVVGECDFDAALVAELQTPNGTEVAPAQPFLKTWQVLNNGTCWWEPGTRMVFVSGDLPGIVQSVNLPITEPGQSANVSVGFIAPDRPGAYASFWQLQTPARTLIDTVFTASVVVTDNPEPTPTPVPPAPSPTEGSTAVPAPPTNTAAPTALPPTPTTSPPPANTATPPAGGWLGEYFNNPNLQGSPITTRMDPEINFDWGTGAPMEFFPSNQFSIRWTQNVTLEEGNYRFFAQSDDGVRVRVNNQIIIDEWEPVQGRTFQADISLGAGSHTMRVDYFEDFQLANVRVWWERQSGFAGWRGEYFPNQSLTGSPALVRDDPAVSFNWGTGAPAANLPKDSFSARWTRTISMRAATYEFNALVDDGVRVWLDNVLVIDAWQAGNMRQVQGRITVAAGDHAIRVEYFENTLDAAVWVWWDTGGSFPDWRGEYWANSTFAGPPELVRNDATIDFRWGFDSPAEGIPADRFSVRWARLDEFSAGTYRITAGADGPIRVYVSGQLVIDRWFAGDPNQELIAEIPLSGTQSLVVLYRHESNSAEVKVTVEQIGP